MPLVPGDAIEWRALGGVFGAGTSWVSGVADGRDKKMERVETHALDVLGEASRYFVAHRWMLGCHVASSSLQ